MIARDWRTKQTMFSRFVGSVVCFCGALLIDRVSCVVICEVAFALALGNCSRTSPYLELLYMYMYVYHIYVQVYCLFSVTHLIKHRLIDFRQTKCKYCKPKAKIIFWFCFHHKSIDLWWKRRFRMLYNDKECIFKIHYVSKRRERDAPNIWC